MRTVLAWTGAGALCAAAAGASARPTYTASGPVPIPDAGPGGCITSPVTGAGTLEVIVPEVLVITSVTVGVHILHTYQGDLEITLEKVGSGPVVTLVHLPASPQLECGYSAHDFGTVAPGLFVLDDDAPSPYDLPTVPIPGINQVMGHWKPESPLSAFDGMDSNGTWRLTVVDHTNLDAGTLEFFSLTIEGFDGCYADCNKGGSLTIADFICFQGEFVQQTAYADCNNSGTWTIADFICFQAAFVAGCP